jgi:hypothetical protein
MIKNLVKVCASSVPKSPRAGAALTPRTYVTEANEYVYNISRGNISGVDPACVGEDPVCSKILREMNGEASMNFRSTEMESADIHIIGKIWLTPLAVNHEKIAMDAY